MCYDVIKQSDLANKTLVDIESLVKTIPQKPLSDLRYSDIFRPANSCIGLYFIESPDGSMLYIGKSCSRSIAERIGSHFDCRSNSVLNSLVRAYCKKRFPEKNGYFTDNDLYKAFAELQDWKFLALFVEWTDEDYAKRLISKVESLLIFHLHQKNGGNCINGTRRIHNINVNTHIKSLIP